jgi:hypothetical protein
MGGLCCYVDTKLPALARMTQSQKLLSREARVIGRRYASGRDSLDTDPFLFNFVALTEFLILRGYNSLDEFADFRSSQSTSVRAFAYRVDSCAVQGQFY